MVAEQFKEMNWLPTKERVEQCIITKVFQYWKGYSPFYRNELFVTLQNTYKTRSHSTLEISMRQSNLNQKSIAFMVPSI